MCLRLCCSVQHCCKLCWCITISSLWIAFQRHDHGSGVAPGLLLGSSSRLVAPGVALGSSSLAQGVALGVAVAMANAIAGARSACCANHGFNGVRATRLPSPGESEPNPTPFGSNIGYKRFSVCTFCLPAGGGYLVQCFRPELVCEISRLFVECFQTISSKAHTHTNTRKTQQLAGNSGETRVKIG